MKTLSIRSKLIAIGVATAVGFVSLVGIGWVTGSRSLASLDAADALSGDVEVISTMRFANIKLILAAMDSIIDREEGAMQPERTEIIASSLRIIRDGIETAARVAVLLGEADLTATLVADVAELARAVEVDLPGLIASRADAGAFAALDDAIDGGGERAQQAFTVLAERGTARMHAELAAAHAAAEESKILQSSSALVFLVLVCVLTALIGRGIIGALARLRADMQAVAGGELRREIKGAEGSDEIGLMARALVSFREAAVDKARIEAEAEAGRSTGERERAEREAAKADEDAEFQRAVEALAGALTELSQGDLRVHIDQPFTAGLERLRLDFNTSIRRLSDTLSQVAHSSGAINANAGEMRASVSDLSHRTEQQAVSLEETSAALDQITATVRSSSQRAQEASRMADEAEADGASSNAIVADAVSAMGRIEAASGEIAKIIGVIDEIAFQTNLLALNAGVEAARAGEAGRGFAVVAQEVRELAQRSAGAAKEIKTLIERSAAEVRSGVDLVTATGSALSKISGRVIDISGHIGEIATAAREQSSGLDEITSAVNQLDQVTQQNAAMVEEATAATHSLAGESDSLAALLGSFRLAQPGQSPARDGRRAA
ncbi:methyl-accepting chemotaxis protein [Hoeflea marina]|nr:methyl-accepting chemotaxis protein [Hoeflea marina]